ncbi:MAG: Hsp70 family protein, partial [Sulfurovaceae bacterium]|nr:Hsp70 family protein [Sulfurovaceae bacterium]
TVLFYSFEDKQFYVGDKAVDELKLETMGRYLVALKSFLGSNETIETTLGTTTYSLEELISIIIRRFKQVIEKHVGQSVERVVMGRPVHFNDSDETLDQEAQNRLERAALQAGFKEVVFQYEPIAAALSYEKSITKEELILVADIGGGTTDYTIIRVGGKSNKVNRREDILATHGTYVGGNSFDSEIIKNFIVSHLGRGSLYKNMGKEMEIGPALYTDFSQWHRFQKMYDIKVLNSIEKLIYMAYDKEKISRLLELIKEGLYFSFSEKIIESKVQLSFDEVTKVNMNMFENPFEEEISQEAFNAVIAHHIEKIKSTLNETMQMANISYEKIDRVFLTGGSTLVPAIRNIYTEIFDKEKIIHTDVFSSVGYGLAIYSGEVWL